MELKTDEGRYPNDTRRRWKFSGRVGTEGSSTENEKRVERRRENILGNSNMTRVNRLGLSRRVELHKLV